MLSKHFSSYHGLYVTFLSLLNVYCKSVSSTYGFHSSILLVFSCGWPWLRYSIKFTSIIFWHHWLKEPYSKVNFWLSSLYKLILIIAKSQVIFPLHISTAYTIKIFRKTNIFCRLTKKWKYYTLMEWIGYSNWVKINFDYLNIKRITIMNIRAYKKKLVINK